MRPHRASSLGKGGVCQFFGQFFGRRLDLKAAYTQLGISPQDRGSVVVAVYSPVSGTPSYFIANSMLFGTGRPFKLVA
eukprot:1678324-Amphidinium_carterae.1